VITWLQAFALYRYNLGAIRSLLATTRLGEFLAARHIGRPEGVSPPRNVLVLTPSVTVGEALKKLVRGGRGRRRRLHLSSWVCPSATKGLKGERGGTSEKATTVFMGCPTSKG
jgi:hypothetical protein